MAKNDGNDEGIKIPVNGRQDAPDIKDTPEEGTGVSPELEKAQAEAKEAQDKYLRLLADTENYKKRMARESIEREKFYNEGLLKDFLPVLDNLDRALAHAGEGCTGDAAFVEGVKMVQKQFMDTLAKFGVMGFESVGQPFDPERHQAVAHVETEEQEPGTVVQEFQKGYFLNDRLLRAAMVTVAKKPEQNQ
ncbi:MAG TPA: nucleotide exchange factor GrpE [Nitrospirota bacterium]